MSAASDKLHREWLNLIDISGPFLTLPVLGDVFPQGLDGVDSSVNKRLRTAHEEWTANNERRQPDRALHRAWVEFVLEDVLDWPREALAEGPALPPGLIVDIPEHGARLRPDLALMEDAVEGGPKPRVLVAIWPPEQELDKVVPDKRWAASPAARMAELLRGAGVRLGLVTNGEQWMLVDAPRGETAAFVTWEATLWLDEPITLRAFVSLLGTMRILGESEERTLEALLARSKQDQAEVTTKLGNQVRHAVELLVRSIDRADRASDGELLAGVSDEDLYEAAITVMMRLVFLLFAEDQRPPLIGGTPLYAENYAVSPLRDQVRSSVQGNEDVLERRHDAWARLLAVFRLVHAGSEHEDMRFPPYGGSLFDPDRFPFLEGRPRKTRWVDKPADPLLIDNRVVLQLLDAIQQLGGQRLSFRGLDVEQIGHVYENLLGHVARRAEGPTLALQGKLEPEVALAELEAQRERGEDALIAFLKEETGRSASALAKSLAAIPDLLARQRLLEASGHDAALLARVLPFAGLIRDDDAGRPLVIPDGGRYVTTGSDRKNLGAHYTPRSLTEPIVRYALEPLVYDGPAEGKPAEEWTLHSPQRLLDLKICDPAMGSGAFLVQACRYLSERLLEAWDAIEAKAGGKVRITPEGRIASGNSSEELLPQDRDERLAVARRIVADRCLYGVDKNHLAVEMAKLSLWLTTLQKDRPFTFVDHALRFGDSLLGIASLDQLTQWSLTPKTAAETRQTSWFTRQVTEALEEATRLREQITATDVRSVADAAAKTDLLRRSEMLTGVLRLGADLLVAAALHPNNNQREVQANRWQAAYSLTLESLQMVSAGKFTQDGVRPTFEALDRLRAEAAELLGGNRPFHWPLEFPEAIADTGISKPDAGFSAIVGNPPFLGGRLISSRLGVSYLETLKSLFPAARGASDLAAYFFRRGYSLLRPSGSLSLLATTSISQTATRRVGLDAIRDLGGTIVAARSNFAWPGESSVIVSWILVTSGSWLGAAKLDGRAVASISTDLTSQVDLTKLYRLLCQLTFSQGVTVYGKSFIRTKQELPFLLKNNPGLTPFLRWYVNGEIFNNRVDFDRDLAVIDFGSLELTQIAGCDQILEEISGSVAQERANQVRQIHEVRPWLHWDKRTEFLSFARGLGRIIACSIVTAHLGFRFVDPEVLLSHQLKIFATADAGDFGQLQSSLFEVWTRSTSSTLGSTLRFSTNDSLLTYPFIPDTAKPAIRSISEVYHQLREDIMRSRDEGLTPVYNRFHDPSETGKDIAQLRDLHAQMDYAICSAFGWKNLDLGHSFHETAQGVRFTISGLARPEVLNRLLELNHQRHGEEVALGVVDQSGKPLKKKSDGANRKGTRRKSADPSLQPGLRLE